MSVPYFVCENVWQTDRQTEN